MISVFPLNAFAWAVVDRPLNLGDICVGNFSVVHVCSGIVRFGEVIAIQAEILGMGVRAEATAGAVIFNDVNFATHVVKIRKLNMSSSFCKAGLTRHFLDITAQPAAITDAPLYTPGRKPLFTLAGIEVVFSAFGSHAEYPRSCYQTRRYRAPEGI